MSLWGQSLQTDLKLSGTVIIANKGVTFIKKIKQSTFDLQSPFSGFPNSSNLMCITKVTTTMEITLLFFAQSLTSECKSDSITVLYHNLSDMQCAFLMLQHNR